MEQFVKHIEIANFKSIKDIKIKNCAKINIFVGAPNAGKSNILEALAFFSFIKRDKNNKDLRKFVRIGADLYNLFYEANSSEAIEIGVNDDKVEISQKEKDYDLKNPNFRKLKIGNFEELYYLQQNFSKKNVDNIKFYKFKEEKEKSLEYFNGELKQPYGENIASIIFSNEKIRNTIRTIFEDNHLKILFEKNSNEIKVFKEYQDGTIFTLPYEMIADTLQRLVFYKTLIMSNKNSVLLLEEPEAHCFEPYILEFTNEVKYNENNNQFFIVTHSDFIIQEFLRDEESKENTQIYLVNNVQGQTQVKPLNREENEDVYDLGMNVFFNFNHLWEKN